MCRLFLSLGDLLSFPNFSSLALSGNKLQEGLYNSSRKSASKKTESGENKWSSVQQRKQRVRMKTKSSKAKRAKNRGRKGRRKRQKNKNLAVKGHARQGFR